MANSPVFGRVCSRLVASKTESEGFEAWVTTLTTVTGEEAESSPEIKPPLEKLPEGPWRSLGGYFDYRHWPDRDRFLELDKAIATNAAPISNPD